MQPRKPRKRTPTYAADLADLPEDERIRVIAQAVEYGQVCGIIVDDEPSKVARFHRKLMARGCVILSTTKSIEGTVVIRVGPRALGTQ
jgi:hypothetical protein